MIQAESHLYDMFDDDDEDDTTAGEELFGKNN
jgi:hypothetical protein